MLPSTSSRETSGLAGSLVKEVDNIRYVLFSFTRHFKCYTLNVHWFAETVYEVNNLRYA